MLYNQSIQPTSISMPLLMRFTKPEKIQEIEAVEPIIYNPISQTVYDMRVVGTKSLRSSRTKIGSTNMGKLDHKNEIDDQKNG